MIWFSLLFGGVFGLLAGSCAFLITWQEYEHHHMEPRQLWRMSLESFAFAFLVFMGLSLFVGYLWSRSMQM